MKITALEIDGYGVWSGLKLQRLSDGMNVLYGPNEAGKTTLLCFVRSVLYGFSPERRRYLPPAARRPARRLDRSWPGPTAASRSPATTTPARQPGSEELTLTAADGTRQGEHMLKVLLSNIDETIFSNIFAVGLREMQELGTLSDSDAAELLYNLSAGVDRVSLVDVLRRVGNARETASSTATAAPARSPNCWPSGRQLRQEIEQLDDLMRRYGRLAGEPAATRPRDRPPGRGKEPRRI